MYVSLHIPDLPVAAALRGDPSLRAYPCGILATGAANEPADKLRLISINPQARAAGLEVGWPLNRALVRCPDLKVIARDDEREGGLRAELVRLTEALGPDLEITACDAVTVDLSTRVKAIDPALEALADYETEIWHARASTPDLAFLSARHDATRGGIITSTDLQPLPIGLLSSLPCRGETPLSILGLWGLKTLGDFMGLPRQALTERLGPDAARWHDLLHGKTCRLLRLHRPPDSLAQTFDFDDPVTSLDPVVFAIKRMLHTLAARLGARHLAASRLDLSLVLVTGRTHQRQIRLPDPQTAVEGMLSPLQSMLDSLRLDAPVSEIHLDAATTFATSAQREWFGRQMPEPARWAETLAKLDAMLGAGRVGIPMPSPSYRPDSGAVRAVVEEAETVPAIRPDCAVPLHRYRPPRKVAVAYEERVNHPWPLALLNGQHVGEIVDSRGPFSISGNWWNPAEAWSRLEWDVQLGTRHLLRLVFQKPDHWQLDGIYK